MNQFEPRHYKFMREYRGTGGERMAIRNDVHLRPGEPHASFGDKIVAVVALLVVVLWIIFVKGT
jgi:hypothetical protein